MHCSQTDNLFKKWKLQHRCSSEFKVASCKCHSNGLSSFHYIMNLFWNVIQRWSQSTTFKLGPSSQLNATRSIVACTYKACTYTACTGGIVNTVAWMEMQGVRVCFCTWEQLWTVWQRCHCTCGRSKRVCWRRGPRKHWVLMRHWELAVLRTLQDLVATVTVRHSCNCGGLTVW